MHPLIGLLAPIAVVLILILVLRVQDRRTYGPNLKVGQVWVSKPEENPFREPDTSEYRVDALQGKYVKFSYDLTTALGTRRIESSTTRDAFRYGKRLHKEVSDVRTV
jgi:hypothetical protein